MFILTKRLGVAAFAGAVVLGLGVSTVSAQPVFVPTSQRALINPFNRLSTSLALNQWANNASLVGRNYNALTYGTATNPFAPYGMNPAANLFSAYTTALTNPFINPFVPPPLYSPGVGTPYGGGGYGGYGGYPPDGRHGGGGGGGGGGGP